MSRARPYHSDGGRPGRIGRLDSATNGRRSLEQPGALPGALAHEGLVETGEGGGGWIEGLSSYPRVGSRKENGSRGTEEEEVLGGPARPCVSSWKSNAVTQSVRRTYSEGWVGLASGRYWLESCWSIARGRIL